MSQINRRGLSLVELLVALVILGLVSASLYRVLVNNQRVYQAQTQRIDLQQNIRAAVTILPAEFRELDASDGDILAMGPNSISIRAFRVLGFICSAPNLPLLPLAGQQIIVRDSLLFGSRGFIAGSDQIMVYYEGNRAVRADDAWTAPTLLTASASQNCPDGKSGTRLTLLNLTLTPLPVPLVVNGLTRGSPVRAFEPVTYMLWQGPDTRYYIALSTSNGIQPLVGPILANGLSFAYYDSTGAVTATPTLVSSIGITVRAETVQPVQVSAGSTLREIAVDSLTTRVALRNNRRF
jgi:prepilin-type N-terminal cleavage/methylation domain-containing protein